MKAAHGLPPALVGLVMPLCLDTDLLADWVHRCRHPLITAWCSGVEGDMQLGAGGDAMQADLRSKRLLVHYPSNNFWRGGLAARMAAAIREPGSTTVALVFGDAAYFQAPSMKDSTISVTRLATTRVDSRVRADKHQVYEGGPARVINVKARWGIWWIAPSPPTPGADIVWEHVAQRIMLLKGAESTQALMSLVA